MATKRVSPAPTQPGTTDPVIVIPGQPGLQFKQSSNLFDASRPGRVVVRPEDLLALRIELHNLSVVAGSPPRLKKTASGAAALVVHLPPQSIGEQTFFETRVGDLGTENPTPPPVRARVAGESRLAFTVPNGFDVPYTLEGVLGAIQSLAPAVTANALPPTNTTASTTAHTIKFNELFASRAKTKALRPAERAALSSFAMRSLRIATVQGDTSTLMLRHASGGRGLAPISSMGSSSVTLGGGATIPSATIPGLDLGTVPKVTPRPVAPGPQQTAIELPWHLILSPHSAERWRHATQPIAAPSGRTELWHSRLVAPRSDGRVIEPPGSDPQRTVRAIWAVTGEEPPTMPMSSSFPQGNADLPEPDAEPFLMPMNANDRFQIVHLSSNYGRRGYTPRPIDTKLLMLSSLGGWLDSRGAWDPPQGLSLEEWVHRGTMARDHYVRIVKRGFLWPFGHRAVLIKISERKFHNGAIGQIDGAPANAPPGPVVENKAGNVAYLRQRKFIVIREKERSYTDTGLSKQQGGKPLHFQFQMPFSKLRIVTEKTPNLDNSKADWSRISGNDLMFWPCVSGQPFRFQCAATDTDGRTSTFDLPAIFIEASLLGNIDAAEAAAQQAKAAWAARPERRSAPLKLQRVALAASVKAGDTALQVETLQFDAEAEVGNASLRAYSQGGTRPPFYPKIVDATVRIAAVSQLTGSPKSNKVVFNRRYLEDGFGTDANPKNPGQVFLDVETSAAMGKLDFSTQGDRSGGFVQPNLTPSALSRLTGPVTGSADKFFDGNFNGAEAFPSSVSDLPLPLLFGCIPLGAVIEAVSGLAGSPEKVPKFASEASTQVESFINGLARLYEFVANLASQPGSIASAAIDAIKHTLDDLLAQAQSYAAPLVADVKTRINQLITALNAVRVEVEKLVDKPIDTAPNLPSLPAAIAAAQTAAANLRSAANAQLAGVSLPSGLRQSLLQVATVIDTFLADVGTVLTLIAQGKTLFTALDDIVGDPSVLTGLLENPTALKTKLDAVEAAITAIRGTLVSFSLLDGAPKKLILEAMDVVVQILAAAGGLLDVLEMLTGDELTIRFDWNPPLASWGFSGPNPPADEALFRANDKKGFLVAVEAKVKKNGSSAPKISVICSLKKFDLVLIAPASFIELNFDKIEFSIDSAAKMNVDVLLDDIKFVGPLSFVETLRDLIPLDGFSDPPYLDITAQGIDAGFDIALPAVSIGVFNLSNLSVGAGFTVPFIGQPLSVRFFFCTREQPFNLTVSLFGGGGFFGITLDPSGIQLLEASFEFGASISVDFGVASGGVYVMAGVYFRMEKDACSLTGYFRLGGYVDVLGLISASLELYLELRYEFESGKCVGKAELTITVEVFIFSGSVTITCEKKFAGSNGDPTFRDLMGVQPALALADELALIDNSTDYAWREYAEAFA